MVPRLCLHSQVLEVGQLEDLGRDGGQAVAVQTEHLQTAGQVGEAARLQRGDAVVVQEPRGQKPPSAAAQAETAPVPSRPRSRGHSQVLERQHGEGGGPDVGDGVVAEVQRLQGEEGLQLLREDARDPVVGSGNTRRLQ